jgi:hypothetical protein
MKTQFWLHQLFELDAVNGKLTAIRGYTTNASEKKEQDKIAPIQKTVREI